MRGVRAEGTAHGECGARSGRAVRARVDRGPAGGAVRRGGGAATLRRPRAPAHERQLAKRSNPGTGGAPRGRAPRQMREATPPAESDSLIEELWKLVRLYRGESVFPEGGAPDETEVVVVLGTQAGGTYRRRREAPAERGRGGGEDTAGGGGPRGGHFARTGGAKHARVGAVGGG